MSIRNLIISKSVKKPDEAHKPNAMKFINEMWRCAQYADGLIVQDPATDEKTRAENVAAILKVQENVVSILQRAIAAEGATGAAEPAENKLRKILAEFERLCKEADSMLFDRELSRNKAEQKLRADNVVEIMKVRAALNAMLVKALRCERGGATDDDLFGITLDDMVCQLERVSEKLALFARDNVITNKMNTAQTEQVEHTATIVRENMKIAFQAAGGKIKTSSAWDLRQPIADRVKEALELIDELKDTKFAKLCEEDKKAIEKLTCAKTMCRLQLIRAKNEVAPDSSPESKHVPNENDAPRKKPRSIGLVPAAKCLNADFDAASDDSRSEQREDQILRPSSQKLRFRPL